MTDPALSAINRTLRRLPNAAYRQREYLTEAEVDRLIEAARKRGRNGPRDAAAILLAYRHGLRAQELCSLCSLGRQIGHPLRGGKCARIHRAHLIRDSRLLLTPAARGPYNRLSSRHVIGSGRT